MKKILFITSRNIVSTSGELRLIKGRTNALFDCFDIQTDFIGFINKKKKNVDREEIGASSSLELLYFDKFNFAFLRNKLRKLVFRKLQNEKYEFVVISGFFPLNLAKSIKKWFPTSYILIDIHGANEELIEYPPQKLAKFKLNYVLYYLMQKYLDKTLHYSDGVMVVSTSLEKYIRKTFSYIPRDFYIIPCGTNKSEINLIQSSAMRNKWRKKLGVESEKLFVYSGGISPWQSIDEVINVFKYIKKKIPYSSRLLIMSKDSGKIQIDDKEIMIMSFSYNDVNEVLCAGDFAFLLREDTITNHVAFPNKFAEYVLSGMPILCSPFVYDLVSYIKKYDIGVIYEGCNEDLIMNITRKLDDKYNATHLVKRKNLLLELSFCYTLRPMIETIGDQINRA